MKLYLDDIRQPPSDDWLIARNLSEFKSMCQAHEVTHISFDHDLGIVDGREEIAMDAVKWLIDMDYPLQSFQVHSANPVGAANLNSLLSNWFKHRVGHIPDKEGL